MCSCGCCRTRQHLLIPLRLTAVVMCDGAVATSWDADVRGWDTPTSIHSGSPSMYENNLLFGLTPLLDLQFQHTILRNHTAAAIYGCHGYTSSKHSSLQLFVEDFIVCLLSLWRQRSHSRINFFLSLHQPKPLII